MLRVIESKNKPITEHTTLAEQLEQVIKEKITYLLKETFIAEFTGALAPLKKWTFTYFV